MGSTSRGDLSTRARIRDAAIECFGQRGFSVSVRTIAEHAEVSPGLVIHHFGSKEKLREACDDHVRAIISEVKTASITDRDGQTVLHQLASMEGYAYLLAYLFRSIQDGGPLARQLYEHMIEDTERYLTAGEESGTIRPSRDSKARARWMAVSASGALLMHVTLLHPEKEIDFATIIREFSDEYMLPMLEIYTEGLLTERTMLDAYLLYISDPPEGER